FVGERIPIRATVFREGHDAVACAAVVTAPDGTTTEHRMAPCEPAGWNRWEARVRPDAVGTWRFHIEAWDDPWQTWVHHAEVKIPAGIDVHLVCAEGADLFARAARVAEEAGASAGQVQALRAARAALTGPSQVEDRLAEVLQAHIRALMEKYAPRPLLTRSAGYEVFTDRRRAGFASWYEFFPRSQGAEQRADAS